MAKIVLNPAIQVLSGDIGGLVYRQQADGSIIVAKAALRDPDYQPGAGRANAALHFLLDQHTPQDLAHHRLGQFVAELDEAICQ